MQIFLCISNQNSKISKIPRTFINLFLILFVTKIDEYKWDKEKFQGEIFINMRFSINSSQIFFHRSTKRSLSVSFLLFKIFQKKNWQKQFLPEIASMGGQKRSWAVSHLEISRPISFESGARLLTAVARVSFSLYRRTWTVSTVFHGIECSLIKPELDISRSSSDVNRQTCHVLLSTRQTSSFKSV